MNKNDFINAAVAVHGLKYDYSNYEYNGSKSYVSIICGLHGEFKQLPGNHINKANPKGCPTCFKNKENEIFISNLFEKFRMVHGNKYDYSSVEFEESIKPIAITCKDHGVFHMRIDAHRNGRGCKECDRQKENTLNWSEYLKKFREIHAEKYDYSRTVYTGYKNRINIVCKIHGEFKLLIASHLKGVGCAQCEGKYRIEKGDIIKFTEIAEEVHNKKFDYSIVNFVLTSDLIKIICPEHGVFEQIVMNHLNGFGCSKCAYDARKGPKFSCDEIVSRFIVIHGGKYNYDKVEIKEGVKDKVIITCSKHGDFLTRIDSHLSGSGCRLCRNEEKSMLYRSNQNDVIERMKVVHSNYYDYSHADYKLSREKITVICSTHGAFDIDASKHLGGAGCRKCANENKSSDKETFIAEARSLHGDIYDYSEVIYQSAHYNVRIRCQKHGIFFQSPNNHKRGQGCPYCGEYIRHLENKPIDTPTIVYYLMLKHENFIFYKIGITTSDVKTRFRTLNSDNVKIIEAQEISTTLLNALEIEQSILSEFQEYRLPMDDVLIKTKGGSECFCDDVLHLNGLELMDYL